MPDPFQNVSAAGPSSSRCSRVNSRSEPPNRLWSRSSKLTSTTFPGTRSASRLRSAAAPARPLDAWRRGQLRPVSSVSTSPELLTHARRLAEGIDNLTFETGDGAALPLDDGTVDAIVFHTVLCHVVAPAELLAEALRVLRPGGTLVVCDADFSKASLAGFDFDPLQACADFFVANYVTDRYLVAKLRTLAKGPGFHLKHFRITSRAVTDADGMLVWVRLGSAMMLGHCEIGQPLADALVSEYERRKVAGTLYGSAVRDPDRDEAGLKLTPALRNETRRFAISLRQPASSCAPCQLGRHQNPKTKRPVLSMSLGKPRAQPPAYCSRREGPVNLRLAIDLQVGTGKRRLCPLAPLPIMPRT